MSTPSATMASASSEVALAPAGAADVDPIGFAAGGGGALADAAGSSADPSQPARVGDNAMSGAIAARERRNPIRLLGMADLDPTIITSADDPRIEAYRDLKDAAAKSRHGVFVAEGRLIVAPLLDRSRFRVRSVFVTPAARAAMADELARAPGDVAIYEATQEVMNEVVGFDIHRGCLAIGERGEDLTVDDLVDRQGPLVVLEDVNNHDNVGGVFRSAAAFGAAGVVLSPGCVDPLYRKAIRVSMGAALRVPFAVADPWPGSLERIRASGRPIAALSLGDGAVGPCGVAGGGGGAGADGGRAAAGGRRGADPDHGRGGLAERGGGVRDRAALVRCAR